jgi:voltage-gated potassium channel Kch
VGAVRPGVFDQAVLVAQPLAFFKTHILDLLIIAVPFFRPLRVTRLARLARLARVGLILARGIGRAKELLSHKGLHFVLLTVAMIIFASAGLVAVAERSAPGGNIHNFGQGLWWAVVTVTTIGYEDHYPVTAFGQGVAVLLMIVGISLIGVLTATVASYFVGQDLARDKTDRANAESRTGTIPSRPGKPLAQVGRASGSTSRAVEPDVRQYRAAVPPQVQSPSGHDPSRMERSEVAPGVSAGGRYGGSNQ